MRKLVFIDSCVQSRGVVQQWSIDYLHVESWCSAAVVQKCSEHSLPNGIAAVAFARNLLSILAANGSDVHRLMHAESWCSAAVVQRLLACRVVV